MNDPSRRGFIGRCISSGLGVGLVVAGATKVVAAPAPLPLPPLPPGVDEVIACLGWLRQAQAKIHFIPPVPPVPPPGTFVNCAVLSARAFEDGLSIVHDGRWHTDLEPILILGSEAVGQIVFNPRSNIAESGGYITCTPDP